MPQQFKCPKCGSKKFHYIEYEETLDTVVVEEWYCDDCKFGDCTLDLSVADPQEHSGEFPIVRGKWGSQNHDIHRDIVS